MCLGRDRAIDRCCLAPASEKQGALRIAGLFTRRVSTYESISYRVSRNCRPHHDVKKIRQQPDLCASFRQSLRANALRERFTDSECPLPTRVGDQRFARKSAPRAITQSEHYRTRDLDTIQARVVANISSGLR